MGKIHIAEKLKHKVSRLVKSQALSSLLGHESGTTWSVPKGHFAVYVAKGEDIEEEEDQEERMSRFVVPIAYLKNPLFLELLRKAEDEFGYDYGMRGVMVPCDEHCFLQLIARLNGSYSLNRSYDSRLLA